MLSIAVIGAGRIGRIHARNVAAHPGARLAGISDPHAPSAEALAAACGTAVISLDEAFTADAVLIGSPTTTHADYIERAARAGKHVFCEKPIDLSAARVRECLATVQAAGTTLMVGFNRRFDANFGNLKARIDAGDIGALEQLVITSRDPGPPPVSYIQTSGGLFRDMMIHDLDLARFILGEEPVELYAAASVLVDPAIGEAGDVDSAMVTLKTASGKLCQINNSRRATYGYDQRVDAHGSKGLLRAGNLTATTEPALPFFLERYAAAYRAELNTFIDAVNAGTAPAPSGDDGLKALLLADAATESAKTGKAIRLAA